MNSIVTAAGRPSPLNPSSSSFTPMNGFVPLPMMPVTRPAQRPLARRSDGTHIGVAMAVRDSLESTHIESILNDDGFEPIPFSTADQLWETFSYYHPRLVITDWNFNREFSGLDLCAKIREQFPSPYVYIIVLSQRRSPEEIDECLDAGADDYVIKPYSPLHIRARMHVALRWLKKGNFPNLPRTAAVI